MKFVSDIFIAKINFNVSSELCNKVNFINDTINNEIFEEIIFK